MILDEFFERATGEKYSDYSTLTGFGDRVRKTRESDAARAYEGFLWGVSELRRFYRDHGAEIFTLAKNLGGMKMVLGGASRFLETQFHSVRKVMLYSDTVLIPDPILPWLEVERTEERFAKINLLENVFILLHLKPLVDADLPYPPVVVFPSWEKALEKNDPFTVRSINNLSAAFFSFYLGADFSNPLEVAEFSRRHPVEFLSKVREKELFIAPGAIDGKNIEDAVKAYRNNAETWRSGEFNERIRDASDAEIVFLGILERLTPQFHIWENSLELGGQPLMALDAHWHYFHLCSGMQEGKLLSYKLLQKDALAAIRSLNSSRFSWLGNVSISDLVILREANSNEQFRARLNTCIRRLDEATLEDLNRVTNEVSHELASILAEHQPKVRSIQEEFNRKHTQTLAAGCTTGAVFFMPALAPLFSAVPTLTLAGKYAWDKVEEMARHRAVSRSLTGILSKAAE
jgi:hypothetical protein